MQIPKVVRETPDVAFIVVRNLHSAALGDGECVILLNSGDTPPTGYTWQPGKDVKQSGGASSLVAGVMKLGGVITSLNVGDYGWAQVYGYHPNVKTTTATLAAATVLTTDAAGAVVAGASTDEPIQRMGISLKTGASNRAGCMLHIM